MSLELAQRLILDEALPRRVVEAALLYHAKERLPFVSALLALYPQHHAVVERALDLASGPAADDLAPDLPLMARLPLGLCSQLAGFPIGITSSSGVVDVLVVDPLDQHAQQEFAHHLGTSVRLVRGRVAHVSRELLAMEGEHGPRTAPQDLTRMNEPAAHSNRPIPLTRLAEGDEPGTHRGVAPPAAVDRLGAERSPPPPAPAAPTPDAPGDVEEEARSRRPSLLAPSSDDLQQALSELAVADDPELVVAALVLGLRRLCGEVFVFSVRSGRFRSRGRTDLAGELRRDASIDLGSEARALARAIELGQYLGPIEEGGGELAFLAKHHEEVCVTRIDVMERPTLALFAAGFESAYDVSLRSDHLARAASDALTRIVLAKKR